MFLKNAVNNLLKADSILFRKFSIKHVVVVESPKQEEKDLQVKLFASLPDGSDIRKDSQSVILGVTRTPGDFTGSQEQHNICCWC